MAVESQASRPQGKAPVPLTDREIINVLPDRNRVLTLVPYGASNWAETFRIESKSADPSVDRDCKSYFLKILRTPDAADRMRGEYTSMVEIFNTVPSFAPQPLGYGQCDQDPDAHFFLCEYLTIDHVLPDPVSLGKNLAELHRKSQSPTGKFGFHCTTFDGKLPLNTTWDSDWKSFFTTLMCGVYKLDVEINGFWKELDDAMQVMLHKLIPRLLDPLTADGRTVKPCLIHDDLWEGNIGTDTATGRVFVFDACAYYAHHEKEMGMWRCGNHAMSDGRYREEYFRNYPPSEPVEEADDRNRLYCVQTMLMHSAHYPGKGSREKALEEITWLREKYCRDM